MILAAGRGERMRPLTDACPKPLLPVAGKPLIAHHVERLAASGFRDLVINISYGADQIRAALGDGSRYGLNIRYSLEPPGALETGGGIAQALPLLGEAPFAVVNGDIWCDYPIRQLRAVDVRLAHLVLVDNPDHHTGGDFGLDQDTVTLPEPNRRTLTFSGIGVYRPELFHGIDELRFPLGPLLKAAAREELVTGEHYRGAWLDVGTPDRYRALQQRPGG